jgi:hypothetical protein
MSDNRQISVPASFIALYVTPGAMQHHPNRAWLEQRHDLCEDLVQLLCEQIRDKVWQLGITQSDAIDRIERSLPTLSIELSNPEIVWVLHRIREVLAE